MSNIHYNEAGNAILTRVEVAQIEREARLHEMAKLFDECKLPSGRDLTPEYLDGHDYCFVKIYNRIAELKGDTNETK